MFLFLLINLIDFIISIQKRLKIIVCKYNICCLLPYINLSDIFSKTFLLLLKRTTVELQDLWRDMQIICLEKKGMWWLKADLYQAIFKHFGKVSLTNVIHEMWLLDRRYDNKLVWLQAYPIQYYGGVCFDHIQPGMQLWRNPNQYFWTMHPNT